MIYRTRVELGSTGYVAYCGRSLESALEAFHASQPWEGEQAVCEQKGGETWEPLLVWHGGKPRRVCERCGGTGDGTSSLSVCGGCQGKGVK